MKYQTPRKRHPQNGGHFLCENLLAGMHVLILEDEFLIALELEQRCRDCGAAAVTIVGNLSEFDADPLRGLGFHAAVLDVMVGGRSTFDVARDLRARRIPFVFATGHVETEEIVEAFAGVDIVEKPYSSDELIDTLLAAILRERAAPSGGV